MEIFGPGVIIGTLPGGTPVDIGLSNEITFSEKTKVVGIWGRQRRAIAVGAGKIETTVKLKNARISGLAIAQLYLGIQPTKGGQFAVIGEAHTLQSTAPGFTLAPPNTGTFAVDRGVIYTASGLPLTNSGTSAPSTGQYSLNASTGVYKFANGDELAGVLASYDYTTGSFGQSMLSGNPLLGPTVSISLMIYYIDPTTNFSGALQVFNCVLEGFDLATKLEDFTYPEINGTCYANAAGNAWQWNIPDNF
jgi:hypothetical protein